MNVSRLRRIGLGLGAAVFALALPSLGRADTTLPQDTVYKSWTLICRQAPQVQGGQTPQKPYCRIYHRVRDDADKTKVLFIATARYQGADRTPMMILTLPAIANLQRGVTFQVDQNQAYRANIQVCTAQSCVAEFKLSDDLMKLFRSGTQVNFVFGVNPQGEAKRAVPLAGFATAIDALQKTGY